MKTKEFSPEELNLIKLAKEYSDEDKARSLMETLRWPNGPVCPHCESKKFYRLKRRDDKSATRKGVLKCAHCRKPYSVTVGSVFEGSHVPLSKWLQCLFLVCSSKKGISAHQVHRMLEINYKTAWFMCHRIRYAMGQEPLGTLLNGVIQCDETYVGGRIARTPGKALSNKVPVVCLVENGGKLKTQVIEKVNAKNLAAVIKKNVNSDATLMTDENACYNPMKKVGIVAEHFTVCHDSKEYARDGVTVNSCESFFSLLKRGIYGTFHHVSKQHLHRYTSEFQYRWNARKMKDGERMSAMFKLVNGRRLYYRKPKKASEGSQGIEFPVD